MTPGHDEPTKRWTAKRRTALVLEILRGDTSVAEAARKHGWFCCSQLGSKMTNLKSRERG
jgi:transposase-like protein